MRTWLKLLAWVVGVLGLVALVLYAFVVDVWSVPTDDPMLIGLDRAHAERRATSSSSRAIPRSARGNLLRCSGPAGAGALHRRAGHRAGRRARRASRARSSHIDGKRTPSPRACDDAARDRASTRRPSRTSNSSARSRTTASATFWPLRGATRPSRRRRPTVEPGRWFLVSDDRHIHVDSRDYGQVDGTHAASTSCSGSSGRGGLRRRRSAAQHHLVDEAAQRFGPEPRTLLGSLARWSSSSASSADAAIGTAVMGTLASARAASLPSRSTPRARRRRPSPRRAMVGGPSRRWTGARRAVAVRQRLSKPPPSLFAARRVAPAPDASTVSSAAPAAPARFVSQGGDSAVSSSGADSMTTGGRERPGGACALDTSLEELMEQAKNYVCRSCSTPVPLGHKFCGRCGAADSARDPERAHAVLRAAPDARARRSSS